MALPSQAANYYWTAGSTTAEGGTGTWDTTTANWSLDTGSPYSNEAWPGLGNVANIRNSSNGQSSVLTLDSDISLSALFAATTSNNTNTSITIQPGTGPYSLNVTPTNSNLIFVSGSLGSTGTLAVNANMNVTDFNAGGTQQFKVYSSNLSSTVSITGDINLSGSTAGQKSLVFSSGTGSGSIAYSGSTTTAPGGTATLAFEFGSNGSNGNGQYTISGANTALGASATSKLWRGTLILENNAALGSSEMQLGGTATSGDTVKLVTGIGGLTINNSMYVADNAVDHIVGGQHTSGVSTFTGPLSISNGDVQLTSAAGGVTDFSGLLFASSGSASVTKVGEGVVRLIRATGNGSFSGETLVNEGVLLVNNTSGEGLGTGAVTVGTGTSTLATLGGTGIVNTAITVEGGGSMSPGDIDTGTLASQVGTFTAGDSVTWNSDDANAGMFFDLGADTASSDQLAISGSFTQGTGTDWLFEFEFLDPGSLNGDETYELISFSSTDFSAGDFSFTSNVGSLDGFFTVNANSLDFTVSAVPETSTYAVFMGLGVLLWVLRNRKRQATE